MGNIYWIFNILGKSNVDYITPEVLVVKRVLGCKEIVKRISGSIRKL